VIREKEYWYDNRDFFARPGKRSLGHQDPGNGRNGARYGLQGYMPGYEDLTPTPPELPIAIVHGWRDDVVPVENSIRFAQACHAQLHVLDGDHRLTENIGEINYYLRRFIEKISA
jgi:fermentation-respiration switch protein FrsA (DUF1100 family)